MLDFLFYKKDKELLLRAADALEKPGAWIKGSMAQDESGQDTDFNDPTAVSFCTVGIIERLGRYDGKAIGKAYDRIVKVIDNKFPTIPTWNDSPLVTQEDVVSVLRKAAA